MTEGVTEVADGIPNSWAADCNSYNYPIGNQDEDSMSFEGSMGSGFKSCF